MLTARDAQFPPPTGGGVTPAQAAAIEANTAKVGITSAQSAAITANTAKTGAPVPSGHGGEILRANSAATALEYTSHETPRKWVCIAGNVDITGTAFVANNNYKFPWDESTLTHNNNGSNGNSNFITFRETHKDFQIKEAGSYRFYLSITGRKGESQRLENWLWYFSNAGSGSTAATMPTSDSNLLYPGTISGVSSAFTTNPHFVKSTGHMQFQQEDTGNQRTVTGVLTGNLDIPTSLVNVNIALVSDFFYSNIGSSSIIYYTRSTFFIEKIL
jgi:hypothetical protein